MSLRVALRSFWQRADRREQRLLLLAGMVLALGLVWWLGIAPAWRTLRAAPLQHAALETQLQQMQQLQAQVENLRAQTTRLGAGAARQALTQALKPLGDHAQTVVQADRVTVTLTQVAPDALAQLLAEARQNARLMPTEAHLKRPATGAWDGTLVFQLPTPAVAP